MWLSLKIALASLAVHKLRTILAMLGVFLGALALTGVQHVSQSMVRQAELETEKLGPNLFAAVSGQVRFRRSGASAGTLARTFTIGDALTLQGTLPGVLAGSPFAQKSGALKSGATQILSTLVGVWPDYARVRSLEVAHGRFISPQDEAHRAMVCVLGWAIAERLFQDPARAVGQSVRAHRAILQVVGVSAPKGADLTGSNQDEQTYVPLSTLMRRLSNQDWINGVYLELAPTADKTALKAAATELLRQRHRIGPGQREDFSVLTAEDTIRLQRQALDLVGTLGLISSSISFSVGGLGILSIMILLVRARRLEIGVRRAAGARRTDIIRQFLLESGLMAGTGGLLGVLGAMGIMLAAARFGGLPFVADPLLLAGALAGSMLLGLVAGAYPAWQASRLQILDVLKPGG
ncbi:MAG: ABC transporter permease [Desulfovibrio sp.]|nr:ABC transporter permease [Desulfovibrio sp.]MCA1986530.1 ABC transporter permease [Desulfovibrio sp.]